MKYKERVKMDYTFIILFSIVSCVFIYIGLMKYWPLLAMYICFGSFGLFFLVCWVIFGLGAIEQVFKYIKQLRSKQ